MYRSSLSDDHRTATSDIQPDFDALVQAQQRPDSSHRTRRTETTNASMTQKS